MVLLPAPVSPTMAKVSPGFMRKLTSSKDFVFALFVVGETDAVEFHVAPDAGKFAGFRGVGGIGFGVEDGEDFFQGCQGALEVGVELT